MICPVCGEYITDNAAAAVCGHCGTKFEGENAGESARRSDPLQCEWESNQDGGMTLKKYIGNADSYDIPDTVDGLKVTCIGGWAFADCACLVSITVPDSVTDIEGRAFSGCTSLTSIAIPCGVTKIEQWAFSGCTSLASVAIPCGVTKIEQWAFSGCTSLASIAIPDSVRKIGIYAFSRCTSLVSINIPEGVTSIRFNAFEGCFSRKRDRSRGWGVQGMFQSHVVCHPAWSDTYPE